MPRHRLARFLLIAFGLAAISYLLVSLYLPSSRRIVLGVDKDSGKVRRVAQQITFLPPHQFYRLSFENRDGAAQRDGVVQVRVGPEKIPVKIAFRIRFGIGAARLPDADGLVREGWSAWMNRRVAEVITAVASTTPVEEFASPVSQYDNRRAQLRVAVANHFARSGLKVTAFEIEKIEIDREALLRHKRNELRRNARGAVGRVAVFAIDGADWELLSEMMTDDRMPNLEAMVKGGASASVQTIQPTVSPLLWTTAATGVSPDRHGVVDFFDRERAGAPVDSRTRHVPALWDIATAFGRSSGVVNWWTSWPPTSPAAFIYDSPTARSSAMIFPESYAANVRTLETPAATIGFGQIARFMNINSSEFQRAVSAGGESDPVVVFRNVLSKTWSDHRTALQLYQNTRPALMMVNYDGTDAVNHLFAPFHPPFREGIDETNYRKYWPTVANYYSEVDRLLGEWLRILPSDTTVVLVSAHGMRWGKERPRAIPEGTSALSTHRNPGFAVFFGNAVAPSLQRRAISVYDITPTVLSLLGLPKSHEMSGNTVQWAFKNVAPIENVAIASYSDIIDFSPRAAAGASEPQSYRAVLQKIGHLNDPNRVSIPVLEDPVEGGTVSSQQWGLYAYYNNLGVQLRQQKKLADASEAFAKAIDLNPTRPTPYLNLAIVMMERNQFTVANEMFERALERGMPNAERYFVDFSALYVQRDLISRATSLLMKGRELFPQSYLIASNLGSALCSAKRYTEGQAELERALGLRPTSTTVLNNLAIIYVKRKEYGRALDYFNRSLSVEPRQPVIRDQVRAVSTWL